MRIGFLGKDNIIRAVQNRADVVDMKPSAMGSFIMEPGEKLWLQGSAQFSLFRDWSIRPTVPVVVKSRGDCWLTDRRLCIACDIVVPGPAPADENEEPPENRLLRWQKEQGDRIYIEVLFSEICGVVESRLLAISGGQKYQLSIDAPAGADSLFRRIPGLKVLPPETINVRESRASEKRAQPGLDGYYLIMGLGGVAFTASMALISFWPGDLFNCYMAVVISLIIMAAPVLYILKVPNQVILDGAGVTLKSRIWTVRLPYSEMESIAPQARAFTITVARRGRRHTSLGTEMISGLAVTRRGGHVTFVAMDPAEAQGLREFYQAYGRPADPLK